MPGDGEIGIQDPEFTVAEWRLAHAEHPGWSPVFDHADGPLAEVRDKWLYVFRQFSDAPVLWHREFRIDADGRYREPRLEREEGRIVRPPEPGARTRMIGPREKISFPHQIGGASVLYYFLLTRYQLPVAQIRELESAATSRLVAVNTGRIVESFEQLREAWGREGGVPLLRWNDRLVVTAVDPLTVGVNLNAAYQRQREALAGYLSNATRQKRLAVAELLLAELDRTWTEGDASTLEDGMRPIQHALRSQGDPLRRWTGSVRENLRRKTENAESAARLLVSWLRHGLIEILDKAARFRRVDGEQVDLPRFANPFALCVERLVESTAGRTYLREIAQAAMAEDAADENAGWLRRYVLARMGFGERAETSPLTLYGTGRKMSGAILGVWSELSTIILAWRGRDAAADLVRSLTYVTRIPMIEIVERTTEAYRRRDVFSFPASRAVGWNYDEVTLEHRRFVIPGLDDESAEGLITRFRNEQQRNDWTEYLSEGGQDGPRRFRESAQEILDVFGAINLLIALKGLAECGVDRNVDRSLAVAGSLAGVYPTFRLLADLEGVVARMSGKVVGLVGAVIELGTSLRSLDRAVRAGNTQQTVGRALQATSAGLTIIATAVALGSGGIGTPVSGILGIVAIILAAVGTVLDVLGAEEEFIVFARHCEWGVDRHSPREALEWAGVRTWSEWRSRPELELAAAMRIQHRFTVQSHPNQHFAITATMIHTGSKFHLTLAREDGASSRYVFDCLTRELRPVAPRPDLRLELSTALTAGPVGPGWFSVAPANRQDRPFRLRVRLDPHGDGRDSIPSNERAVEVAWGAQTASSLDVDTRPAAPHVPESMMPPVIPPLGG